MPGNSMKDEDEEKESIEHFLINISVPSFSSQQFNKLIFKHCENSKQSINEMNLAKFIKSHNIKSRRFDKHNGITGESLT